MLLQYFRGFLRVFYSLSSNVTEISFDLLHARGNPIANHSMTGFRGGLEARAAAGMPPPNTTKELKSRAIEFRGKMIPISELPGQADCHCYNKRKPLARTADAAICPAT